MRQDHPEFYDHEQYGLRVHIGTGIWQAERLTILGLSGPMRTRLEIYTPKWGYIHSNTLTCQRSSYWTDVRSSPDAMSFRRVSVRGRLTGEWCGVVGWKARDSREPISGGAWRRRGWNGGEVVALGATWIGLLLTICVWRLELAHNMMMAKQNQRVLLTMEGHKILLHYGWREHRGILKPTNELDLLQ